MFCLVSIRQEKLTELPFVRLIEGLLCLVLAVKLGWDLKTTFRLKCYGARSAITYKFRNSPKEIELLHEFKKRQDRFC